MQYSASDLEKAFADLWEEENEEHPGLNYGWGTLQDLMVRQEGSGWHSLRVPFWVTQRERVIVATVIQWLGTTCGFAFLCSALGRCDLLVEEIRAVPPPRMLPEDVRFMRFDKVRDGRVRAIRDGCEA